MAPRSKRKGQQAWLPLFLEFVAQLRIQSKDRAAKNQDEAERGVPLDLFGSQRMFLNEIMGGLDQGIREFLCLKSRQLGASTISLAIDIFWLFVHPGIIGALVTDTDANRDAFREILKRYIQVLDPAFTGGLTIVRENRNFMLLSNGSRLDYLVAGVSSKKENWGESRAYTFAHLTECAKYGSATGLQNFRESLSTEHPDRLFIYESTANGMNHWKAMWDSFGEDDGTKHRFFIGWWAKETNVIPVNDNRFGTYGRHHPDAEEKTRMQAVAERFGVIVTMEQLAWWRWKRNESISNPGDLDQNQPWLPEEAFILSGFSFFSLRLIEKELMRVEGAGEYEGMAPIYQGYRFVLGNDVFAGVMEEITEEEDRDLIALKVWEDPVDDAEYVVSCDPAHGANEFSDRHCIQVWRCFADRLVMVAEYCQNDMVETRQCAWILAYICGAYSQGQARVMMILELYGPGRVVMNELENVRQRVRSDTYAEKTRDKGWDDFLSNASWYMYYRYDSNGGYVKNFETTGRTKREIMFLLRDNFSIGMLDIPSRKLLLEMCNVVQNGNDISAPEGEGDANKDDRVIAAALAGRAWNDWIRPKMVAEGKTFQVVMDQQNGVGGLAAVANLAVMNFLKTEAERRADRDAGGTVPKWMRDRGFG